VLDLDVGHASPVTVLDRFAHLVVSIVADDAKVRDRKRDVADLESPGLGELGEIGSYGSSRSAGVVRSTKVRMPASSSGGLAACGSRARRTPAPPRSAPTTTSPPSPLLDEIPAAYKAIDQADQADLVTLLHTLHQVLNYKGT